MGTLRKLSFVVIALTIIAIAMLSLTIKIKPGEVGVVSAEWTVGLVEKDYGPGRHWDVGPMHTWTTFDTTVQTLHMNRDQEHATRGDPERPLVVKSGDGATVTLDVTIKYQIQEGSVWKVFKEFGSGYRYKQTVQNEAMKIMRGALGALTTEQFYDPVTRSKVAHAMETELRKQLELIHIKLITILIRDLEFDKQFEAQIQKKVISVQEAELNIALTKAAEARGRTKKIEADTEAKVLVIDQERDKKITELRAQNQKAIEQARSTYKKEVTQIKSDADLYAAQKDAEGIKVKREAEAEGQKLRREALIGPGGNMTVALEMARNVNFGALSISTQQTDPLDLDALLKRFGVK